MNSKNKNSNLARAALLFFIAVTLGRLFYLQIVRHDHYVQVVENRQTKKFTIEAERGNIYFYDDRFGEVYPAVVNETRYSLFADPSYIGDKDKTIEGIASIFSDIDRQLLDQQLSKSNTQYVVLRKDIDSPTANKIRALALKGIGLTRSDSRAYIEGDLARQVIGFINDEGDGQYGVEGYLDQLIGGNDGQYKSIIDARGLPVTYSDDNVLLPVQDGQSVVMTIDRSLQQFGERRMRAAIGDYSADSASLVILDADNGEVVTMAGSSNYDIEDFSSVSDFTVFQTPATYSSYEPGSVVKPITMALGLDKGVVSPESRYFNSGRVVVDESEITNVNQTLTGSQATMQQVLSYSLNTGTVHVLSQLGGGSINEGGKQQMYDFFRDLGFSKATSIEQVGEAAGLMRAPKEERFGGDIRYANMSFGQGLSMTQVQLAAAYGALANGGDYYSPTLVKGTYDNDSLSIEYNDRLPERAGVISSQTSETLLDMMDNVVASSGGTKALHQQLSTIGGKTGTAQIANPSGGYYSDRYIGSYVGLVRGQDRNFVVVVRVDDPQVQFAGSGAAAPIFVDVANELIQYYGLGETND